MGYVMVIGRCIGCDQPFSFNPMKVPSIRVEGVREPICQSCVDRANPMRKANGLEEIVVDPEAYGAADENEM